MNYILSQVEESLHQIISLFNLQEDTCYQLLYQTMLFIIDENSIEDVYKQKTDLLNLIFNLKNHLKSNPYNKVKLLIVQQQRKLGDIDETDLDLHKNCKKQLNDLADKLAKRDQILKESTTNYMREISTLTEQIYRINHAPDNLENHIIDRNLIKDQVILDIINKNIEKISNSFENKIRHLHIIVEAQKKELILTKQQLKEIKLKSEYHQQPEYLIRKLGQLEKDPYIIWKHFQDYHGNLFLLQVFKFQKTGYGINYKEIDEILSQSNIIERELQYYQRLIEASLTQFMERLVLSEQKLKESYLSKDMDFQTQISTQQQMIQTLSSNYQSITLAQHNYTNKMLLKCAIIMWKTYNDNNQDNCTKQHSRLIEFCSNLAKFKLSIENIDIVNTYHHQYIQLQSKLNWQQRLSNSQQQNLIKLQFQKGQLENFVSSLKQYDLSLEKQQGQFSNKISKTSEKEIIERLKQHNLEQYYYDKYLQGQKSEQFTQTDNFSIVSLQINDKIPMQNEVIKSQLLYSKPATDQQWSSWQSEYRKEAKSSLKNTPVNFDFYKSKTPRNKTFSQQNSSLDSNFLELKPKMISVLHDQQPINQTQKDSEKAEEQKSKIIHQKKFQYQKVDLLKQVKILHNLQQQLQEIGSPEDQHTVAQKLERGFRTSTKRKPNLCITFEEFQSEFNSDALEIFSSTQRQNKIKRFSTKNSEYLVV